MASHALCPAGTWGGCAGGICVPPKLAEEWYARLGGDRDAAEAHIRAMVDAAMAEVQRTGAVPGDKPYDFWRAVWAATHAAQAPTAPSRDSKGHATMSALSEALAARRQS